MVRIHSRVNFDADAETTGGDPDRQPISLGARSDMASSSYDPAICIKRRQLRVRTKPRLKRGAFLWAKD